MSWVRDETAKQPVLDEMRHYQVHPTAGVFQFSFHAFVHKLPISFKPITSLHHLSSLIIPREIQSLSGLMKCADCTFVFIITSSSCSAKISSSSILQFYHHDSIQLFGINVDGIRCLLCGALVRRKQSNSKQYTSIPQFHATIGSTGTGGHHNLLCRFAGGADCDNRIRFQWAHNPKRV